MTKRNIKLAFGNRNNNIRKEEKKYDFYPTPSYFVQKIIEVLKIDKSKKILEPCNGNGLVIMFLKLLYIESKKRKEFFKLYPPKFIYVSSERLNIYGGTGICYTRYIWEKGFRGDIILKLI